MRGHHGTRPTRLCQHHFHLPPRLLVDAREHHRARLASRMVWSRLSPQSRDRWGFCGQKPISIKYVRSSADGVQTYPESTMSLQKMALA